ncbi:MAG: threonine ammonia-lyase [Thermoprotei archaeon]|nr:MAG: threonine ammonia-lyase [Thermoprotei archaeon]
MSYVPSTSDLVRAVYSRVLEAKDVLERSGDIRRTPLDYSTTLSRLCRCSVYLKLENLQKTGSFKVRGAYYKIWRLSDEEKRRGVVAASAGNHAQGVAYSASRLGVSAKIVMPYTAPLAKVEATRNYGAEVILHGSIVDEAVEKALEIARAEGRAFVHPYDDLDVIAGQGTIGLEILEDLPDVDVVIVPVGGGGLISGIATALKMRRKGIKVIGVQAEAAPAMALSWRSGKLIEVTARASLADGIVVKKPGTLTLPLVRELVDDFVLVSEDEIAEAIFFLLERCKVVVEGAGAVGVAALLSGKVQVEGRKVVVVVSGGNIDMTTLLRVVNRELVKLGRVVRIRVVLPDVPGTLKEILQVLARARANIIDIQHDRSTPELKPMEAVVTITFEAPSRAIVDEVLQEISKLGYRASIL